MSDKKINITEKIEEIIKAAEKTGSDTSVYYISTLNRYNTQLQIMERLKQAMATSGSVITKDGIARANPLIAEYNRTATAANQTVQTLIKIVQAMESIMDV